ncbi:hypothetical protein [Sphingomonas faeni]|uniref:hypothetical protein n=1 Tax=Sphingomonas faeni TaxID=185950 RepID=UPI0027899CB4|nr:hypothetical protein [Sphingomonas faeni]MDQ0836966.1 putative membrane protein [Sphingomonas faeni]
MKVLIAATLIMASSAGATQTAAPPVPADATAPAAKSKPPKPVCRSEDKTGSMFPTRTCHSKEEWTAIDAANASNVERMSNARKSAGRN